MEHVKKQRLQLHALWVYGLPFCTQEALGWVSHKDTHIHKHTYIHANTELGLESRL